MFTVQLWKESPGSEVAGKAVKFTYTVYRLVVLYTTRGGGGVEKTQHYLPGR